MPADDLIEEFRNVIPQDVCSQFLAKFDHYEQNPGQAIKVEDKFTSDGGGAGDHRTKEAKVIYLHPPVLQENDSDFMAMVTTTAESIYQCFTKYVKNRGIVNMAPLQIDQIDFMKYEKGQGFYGPHVDAGSRALAHRVMSLVLYLNDVEEGGETEFPVQRRKVRPEAGKLVLFPSFFGFVHQSNRTISGPKYVLACFTSFAV